jgi:hybrid cluster-associated redox disulfide protein
MAKKKASKKAQNRETNILHAVAKRELPSKAKPFRVTKDTLIGEAADKVPDAAEIMFSYGLHCFGCGMTAYETIEQGCSGHGMGDEEIESLVDELNDSLERQRKN